MINYCLSGNHFEWLEHLNLQKKILKYNLPKLINDTPERVKDKIKTNSLQSFINYGKNDMIHKYSNICII